MPIVAVFFGITIRVFHADHPPPHLHVQYGEFGAVIEIASGRILGGGLPARVLRLVREWLRTRRRDILESWGDAQEHRIPRRVKPLE